MIKKKILLCLILVITACGYEPIYLKKNDTLSNIIKIQNIGEYGLNRKILSLVGVKKTNNKKNGYELVLKSEKKKEIVAKDSYGNASSFRITIKIVISIIDTVDNKKIIKYKEFDSSFTYSNQDNKFELAQDEQNIENNLIEAIAEKIVIYLNS